MKRGRAKVAVAVVVHAAAAWAVVVVAAAIIATAAVKAAAGAGAGKLSLLTIIVADSHVRREVPSRLHGEKSDRVVRRASTPKGCKLAGPSEDPGAPGRNPNSATVVSSRGPPAPCPYTREIAALLDLLI